MYNDLADIDTYGCEHGQSWNAVCTACEYEADLVEGTPYCAHDMNWRTCADPSCFGE